MTARPSRRTVLVAGLLAPAACARRVPAVAPRPAAPDPDPPLRAAAVAREQALVLLYDAAAQAAPPLAARLAPLRAEHARHLLALGASDSPVGTAVSTAGAPAGLPGLRAAERVASTAHGDAALSASRSLAAVLASLSASEASHAGALA